MWIQHILQLIIKYQGKTPDNYKGFLDIKLDLTLLNILIN